MFNGGFGGLGNIMKQAQAVQEKMKQVKAEIAKMEAEGQSGSGMVKVVLTGDHQVRRVSLDPSLKEEDIDMIEDLITAAFNDAANKIDQKSKQKMEQVSSGLPLPKGFMDMF